MYSPSQTAGKITESGSGDHQLGTPEDIATQPISQIQMAQKTTANLAERLLMTAIVHSALVRPDDR